MRWLLLLGLVAGCHRTADQQPSCAELTEHLYEVTKIAYPGHGEAMEMGNRKADIAACEQRKPAADERRCIMAAKDLAQVATCRKAAVK